MVMLKIRESARSRGGNWGGIALKPAPAPHERNRNVEEMRAHEEGKYSDQYHAQHWNTENAHADGPRQLHSVGRALTVAAEAAAVTLTGPTRGTEAQRCAAQHSSYHHLHPHSTPPDRRRACVVSYASVSLSLSLFSRRSICTKQLRQSMSRIETAP